MKPAYKIIISSVFTAICGLILSSCATNPPSTNLAFAGTYKVARGCTGDTVLYKINAGNNDATVYIPIYPASTPSCVSDIYLTCVVSGHNITAVQQNIYDACNKQFQYTLTGTLNNNILTLNWTKLCVGVDTTTCTYVGPKQ